MREIDIHVVLRNEEDREKESMMLTFPADCTPEDLRNKFAVIMCFLGFAEESVDEIMPDCDFCDAHEELQEENRVLGNRVRELENELCPPPAPKRDWYEPADISP